MPSKSLTAPRRPLNIDPSKVGDYMIEEPVPMWLDGLVQ